MTTEEYCHDRNNRQWLSWIIMGVLSAIIACLTPGALRKAQNQRTESRTAQMLDKLDMGTIAVNRDGHITHFSRGAEKLLNCTADEVLDKSMLWMVPPRMRDDHQAAMAAWWKSTDYSRRIMDCVWQDFNGKEIPLHITLDPIRGDDGKWEISVQVEPQKEVVRLEVPPDRSHKP